MPIADQFYTAEQRALQARHDSMKLADAVVAAKASPGLVDAYRAKVLEIRGR